MPIAARNQIRTELLYLDGPISRPAAHLRDSRPSDAYLMAAVEALGVHTGGHTGSKAQKDTA